MLMMRRGAADDVKEGKDMENDAYVYGIPKEELQKNLEEWLENPAWRKYYEKAPSEQCREFIALEFLYSEEESDEIAAAKADGHWLRYTGKAVFETDPKYAAAMLDMMPQLKDIYNEQTGNKMMVFHLEDATARIIPVMGKGEAIDC